MSNKIYELRVNEFPHEPSTGLGTYATKELAEQAQQFLLANWPNSLTNPPVESDFFITEKEVLTALPTFQLFQASVDLKAPESVEVWGMTPEVKPYPVNLKEWLPSPRTVIRPRTCVRATGDTAANATLAVQALVEQLNALGVMEFLDEQARVYKECTDAAKRQAELEPSQECAFLTLMRVEELAQNLVLNHFGYDCNTSASEGVV